MTDAAAGTGDGTRRWRAVAVATLILLISYWAVLWALLEFVDETLADRAGPAPASGLAAPVLAVGMAILPLVFASLAAVSRHRSPAMAVAKAIGLFVIFAAIGGLAAQDIVTAMVVGVGAGGVVSLRREYVHRGPGRWVAVAGAGALAWLLVAAAQAVAILVAPFLPLVAVAAADEVAEQRQRRAAGAGAGEGHR